MAVVKGEHVVPGLVEPFDVVDETRAPNQPKTVREHDAGGRGGIAPETRDKLGAAAR
jgi:hypothetical protein